MIQIGIGIADGLPYHKKFAMKPIYQLHFVFVLFLFLCAGCENYEENPAHLVDKRARVEFYTTKDFSDPNYDQHQVNLRAGVRKITYDPYKEETILDDSTGWIAFKDIPAAADPIIFEALIPEVDVDKQTVLFGYTYVIKIGEYTELYAAGEYLQDADKSKVMRVVF